MRFSMQIKICTFNRLKIFSEESVPLFGPPLPSPPVFTNHQEFRDFVLVKCKSVFLLLCSFNNRANKLKFTILKMYSIHIFLCILLICMQLFFSNLQHRWDITSIKPLQVRLTKKKFFTGYYTEADFYICRMCSHTQFCIFVKDLGDLKKCIMLFIIQ